MLGVNDSVRSKNPEGTTKNFVGKVIGYYEGSSYAAMMERYGLNMAPWDAAFPGWQQKRVYAVHYDIPVKTCTREEWVKQAVSKGISAEAAADDYGPKCIETHSMVFPEDDLELVS
jgi:hypothetical protein